MRKLLRVSLLMAFSISADASAAQDILFEEWAKEELLYDSVSGESCPSPDPSLYYQPVIGIVTHPGDGATGRLSNSTDVSNIAASYVKFVESAGARVNAVGFCMEKEKLDKHKRKKTMLDTITNWIRRFANSLKYYAAVFDALNVSLPEDSSKRVKIEKMFARKIRSVIAREGTERHETFSKWSRKMKDCGFENVGIGYGEKVKSQVILRMYSDSSYYVERKKEDGEALCLKWSRLRRYNSFYVNMPICYPVVFVLNQHLCTE